MLDLLAPLDDEALCSQHSELMSPLVWDLAHIAHFEELWLVRALGGAGSADPRLDDLYDAFAHARSERADARAARRRPRRARFVGGRARRARSTCSTDVELDADDPLLRDGFVYGMVVQHEHQHDETMLQTLQLRDGAVPARRAGGRAPAAPIRRRGAGRRRPFVMGTDDEPWAYDNERPAHEVELAPFWIDAAPVTNARVRRVRRRRRLATTRLWQPAGWASGARQGLEHPGFWRARGRRAGRGAASATASRCRSTSPCSTSAGTRPTRTRAGRASGCRPRPSGSGRRAPAGSAATRGARSRRPRRTSRARASAPRRSARSRRRERGRRPSSSLGDVWEWTARDFTAYPGFEAFPYHEYSEVFFGPEYKVLRGGSWATHPAAVRTTFRNWDFPIRRQIFAGFRCARDA